MAVRLTIVEPGAPERTAVYGGVTDVIIGRASSCDIRLEHDPMVSRLHAGIHIAPPQVGIRDVGSRNGISINGIRFDGVVNPRLIRHRHLRDGDTIVMGRTSIVIEMVPDDSPEAMSAIKTPQTEAVEQEGWDEPVVPRVRETATYQLLPI